jgi:hypothetical protein
MVSRRLTLGGQDTPILMGAAEVVNAGKADRAHGVAFGRPWGGT